MGSHDKNVLPQDDSTQSCQDYIQAFSTQIITAQSRVSNASTEVAQPLQISPPQNSPLHLEIQRLRDVSKRTRNVLSVKSHMMDVFTSKWSLLSFMQQTLTN